MILHARYGTTFLVDTDEQAVSLAKQSGTELKDLGFNINFAPVADLGLTYGRSFSTNPDDVVRYASAVGKAYDEAGLWYSYKHFPGIGKTDVDLHADTSVVPVSKETLLNEDTKVFVDLIKQSKPNTYAIMVSHAMYPQIDPDHPSSLSKILFTRLPSIPFSIVIFRFLINRNRESKDLKGLDITPSYKQKTRRPLSRRVLRVTRKFRTVSLCINYNKVLP